MSDIVRLFLITILIDRWAGCVLPGVERLLCPAPHKHNLLAQSMSVRSLGIGFVNFVFFAVIALVLLSVAENMGPFLKGLLTIPAIMILALLSITLSLGLAAMANLIGDTHLPRPLPLETNSVGNRLPFSCLRAPLCRLVSVAALCRLFRRWCRDPQLSPSVGLLPRLTTNTPSLFSP